MGAMSFEVPDGASVQIYVGKAPMLAPPDETARLDDRMPLRRRSYRVAKSVLAIGFVAGAFILGQHTRLAPAAGAATSQAASLAAPPPVTTAFPDHVSEAVPEPPPQVPQALARQLAQPPTVVPPPGQAAAVAPGLNKFGLDN